MQNYRTILEVIKLRCAQKLSRSVCQGKVKLGNGTYQLIEERFKESGKTYEQLQAMEPEEIEKLFYPESKRRKDTDLPSFEEIYSKVKKVRFLQRFISNGWSIRKTMTMDISILSSANCLTIM